MYQHHLILKFFLQKKIATEKQNTSFIDQTFNKLILKVNINNYQHRLSLLVLQNHHWD